MKNIILIIVSLLAFKNVSAQLPYSWYPGNPLWVSSNPSVNTLAYQNACYKTVSTSDCTGSSWYTYNNSQLTSYTSPTYSFVCTTTVNISIGLAINLETRYDWLYFQYSLNNGSTWINPVALSPSTNGSGINLSAYAPLTTAGTNNNTNGWTGQLGNITVSYNIPVSVQTKFRFIFESDGSVNTYGASNIYYADITSFNVTCISNLPIELVYFGGEKKSCGENILIWKTASESNNDRFEVERSIDGIIFNKIGILNGKGNSSVINNYVFTDNEPNIGINYYRLKQIDYNGDYKNTEIISLDNSCESSVKTIKIYNLLGQEVDESYSGAIFIYRSDNTIIKRFQNEN